jgi:hypothetical protein
MLHAARRLIRALGDNPRPLDLQALSKVQFWVDDYAKSLDNNNSDRAKKDTRLIFQQARRSAPFIIQTFNKKSVPPIIGLYLPVIESEYQNRCTSQYQAKGIYQISLATARRYGLSPEEFCNVERSIQVAADYMSNLINEWGRDSTNMTLAIFSFNRKPELLQRDLNIVVDSPEKERSFWTLMSEQDRLDGEVKADLSYIPRFFAAAIIGENPQAFGLKMQPISSYAK